MLEHALAVAALLALTLVRALADVPGQRLYAIDLRVTSDLPCPNVPMEPHIDFSAIIGDGGLPGVLDPNSICVVDATGGAPVPCAVSEDFAYGDAGRIAWVIRDPAHRSYEVRFRTATTRPPLRPAAYTPLIGTGDLLVYNAGVPRPVCLIYLSGLVDLTGDGRQDLVGCWNYAHRPGRPWDGVLCYPRVGEDEAFEFGDLVRLRYKEEKTSEDFRFLSHTYMTADCADFDGDGLPDLVYCPSGSDSVHFYRNTGTRDAGGMPVFVAAGSVPRQTSAWEPCRAIDLNGDGTVDLVVGQTYLRNAGQATWPPRFSPGVALQVGEGACFLDVDDDGLPDAVCLVPGPQDEPRARRVAWQKNLGGDPPRFAEPEPLPEIDAFWCSSLAAVNQGPRRGLLVLHDVCTKVSFYECRPAEAGSPRFSRFGTAQSLSAPLALSDQAWPHVCDWDGDGDRDLLVGGGYGWPRIVLNEGSAQRPAFAEPRQILSEGRPIRLLRDEILGGRHWHNMGYPYPAFVDWDGDGLPDLVIPNETNRIFWYRNVGTRSEPRFGPREQVICDGYPDSPESRRHTALLAADDSVANSPYPYQEDQAFFWRTGAGFADLNGDGLMDMVTHDGATRKATLFAQYIAPDGTRRLRKEGPLRLRDGRLIDDAIVGRRAHWTEAFRCIDWDGDGLVDLIYSCAGTRDADGSIYLLRNCGTVAEPLFEPPVTLCCFGEPIKVTAHGPHPAVADLDGDGRPDILACVEWSVYPYYSHAAIQMERRPEYELGRVRSAEAGSPVGPD